MNTITQNIFAAKVLGIQNDRIFYNSSSVRKDTVRIKVFHTYIGLHDL